MRQNKALEIITLILVIIGFALIFFGIDSRIRNIEKRFDQIDTVIVTNNYYSDSTFIIKEFSDTTILKELHYFSDSIRLITEKFYFRDSMIIYEDTCPGVPEYRYVVSGNIAIYCDTSKAIDETFEKWFKRFEQTLDSLR